MTTLHAQLKAGDGTADGWPKGEGRGTLSGHPAAVEVRTTRQSTDDGKHDELTLKLYDKGAQIGGGVLRVRDGQWSGTCSEFTATWYVSSVVGSGLLSFSETAKAST